MKWTWYFSLLMSTALLLVSCKVDSTGIPVQPGTDIPKGVDDIIWWYDAVFYEIFVRSYNDSDGDGIGDFNGIIDRLDYLNDGDPETNTDLGVSGLWLMPIHPSTSYHGYDVVDYYAVNPEYGTMEDFNRLLDEAHKRGIRVIIDLVLNHTSVDHPWFQASRDPLSEYRDWYVWSETEPSGSGWHGSDHGYYFGIFWEGMPDLNYEHPPVTEQMHDVARYWLQDIGVDGFRLDAAKHLIEDGMIHTHSDATHEWYKDFRHVIKGLNPEALTVGEVWDNSVTVSSYVSEDELDLAFNFDLAQAIVAGARLGQSERGTKILTRDIQLFQNESFATFLTNHDQDRTMLLMGDNEGKAKVAASILLTVPGVPFLYYGEEIGMIGQKPDEQIRTPMQWTTEENAGFTSGTPWISPYSDYLKGKNVVEQSTDPDSLLSHYRTLIHFRNQHQALRTGEYIPVESNHSAVMAFLRASQEESLLVIINLGEEQVTEYNLSLEEGPLSGGYQVEPLLGVSDFIGDGILSSPTINANGGFDLYQPTPQLLPSEIYIIRLQPDQ